jgi:hypothetical protein
MRFSKRMTGTFLLHFAMPPLAAVAFVAALLYLAQRQRDRLHTRGLHLIYWLKAYSAWVDCQRDEPFLARDIDELALPEPLAQALALKDAAFPELSQHMVRLLQAHSRLIEYLWQHNLLRISQATGWQAAHEDSRYQQIRGAQEDLIEEMIAFCQERIGESAREWKRTGSDFAFSSGLGIPAQHEPLSCS